MALGQIQNALGNVAGGTSEAARGSEAGDQDMMTENRFTTWDGSNLKDGRFVDVGSFVVPAQTGYTWGFGEPVEGKSDNQGRHYFDPQGATPSEVVGRIRYRSRNAVGKAIEDHGTFHTSQLRQTLSDRRTWPFFPERSMDIVGEDSEIYIQFEYDQAASSDSTLSQANSTFRAAVTEFTL